MGAILDKVDNTRLETLMEMEGGLDNSWEEDPGYQEQLLWPLIERLELR